MNKFFRRIVCFFKDHNVEWNGYVNSTYSSYICKRCGKIKKRYEDFYSLPIFWSKYGGVIISLTITIVILASLIGMAVGLDHARCAGVATRMGLEHSYNMISGCMVKYQEQWYTFDMLIRVMK